MHSPWDRRSGFPDPSLEPPNAVTFFLGPTEPSQSQLWSPQGSPRTPLRAPEDAQGPLKSAMSTIKKRWKYVYLAHRDQTKLVFSIFGPLLGLLGPTLVRTHTIPTLPRPPEGPPKTPWDP